MILQGKRVDLPQLQAELLAAGVAVARGLGTAGDELHTYDGSGDPLDVTGATAQSVLAAHVPPAPIDYGTDAQPPDQLTTAVANLRAYIGLATPTAAQTTAAVRLLCRIALFLLRRLLP